VCVHLCIHIVTRGTQVKGTKRMKTQLALRVHEDVAVRHERLLLHADACRQSAVRLAGSSAACSSCRRSGTDSSRSHSARQCSRRRCPSLRRALPSPPSARTSVCARFTLFSHVVWFRSMISPHYAPGSRCSPTSPSSAAWSHLDLHLRATHCTRRVRRLKDHRVHCRTHPRLVVVTLKCPRLGFEFWERKEYFFSASLDPARPRDPINDVYSFTGKYISNSYFTYRSVQIFKILF